jgi:hypothetical protein
MYVLKRLQEVCVCVCVCMEKRESEREREREREREERQRAEREREERAECDVLCIYQSTGFSCIAIGSALWSVVVSVLHFITPAIGSGGEVERRS